MASPAPAPGPRSAASSRLANLDALRAVAALAVAFEHTLRYRPSVYSLHGAHWFNLGVFGVTTFFLVSGFIIPLSLSRSGGLLPFWIKRITRLYPLLWASLVLAAVAGAIGRYRLVESFGWSDWLANASMLPGWFGADMVGPLWTLAYELVFYVAMSLLFVLRLDRRVLLVATGLTVVAVLHLLTAGPGPAPLGAFWYVTFFLGAMLGRASRGGTERRQALSAYAVLAGILVVTIASAAPVWEVLPRLAALVVFPVVLLAPGLRFPRFVTWLGVVSYSIYLLHVTVLSVVPAVGAPEVSAVIWVGLTILCSWGTYSLVERPGMRLGNALTARFARPAPPVVASQPVGESTLGEHAAP